MRPFNFFKTMPALSKSDIRARLIDDYGFVPRSDELYSGLVEVPFYQSPEGPRRVDTHELVQKVDERRDSIPYPTFVPKTLFETLHDYLNNPEDKADSILGVDWAVRLVWVPYYRPSAGPGGGSFFVILDRLDSHESGDVVGSLSAPNNRIQ